MTETTPSMLLAELRKFEWIDLTHSFHPGIPHCHHFDPEQRTKLYDYAPQSGSKGSGFLAHEYRFVGQWGTHVDPPAHFVPGLRLQDEIPVTEMILPLVVLDVTSQVRRDDDYCVTLDDVRAWEDRHGAVPEGAFIALNTGWSQRWPHQDAMRNADAAGCGHWPGWSQPVLRYLYEERDAAATGHDTTDTDPGVTVSSGEAPLERYVLGLDRFQIELLANLDRVPEHGSVIVVTWPKARGGSGFPARAFAIVPPDP